MKKIYIWLLTKIVRSKLMPAIKDRLDQEVMDNMVSLRKQYLTRELRGMPPEQVDKKFFTDIRVPCVFKGVHGGRHPFIELRVSQEMMQRLIDTKFEASYMGYTIDCLFHIPRSTMIPQPVRTSLPQDTPKE